MLEFVIPDNTDTQAARKLLSGKSDADLRKQHTTLHETLSLTNKECKVLDDKGNATGKMDYSKSTKLTGSNQDRHNVAMRIVAEKAAIREELTSRIENNAIQREIEFGDLAHNDANTEIQTVDNSQLALANLSPEARIESIIGNHVQALLDDSGAGAGFDPRTGGRDFLEAHRKLEIQGLTVPSMVNAHFGTFEPQAAIMTNTGSAEGYHPFSYRDLNEAILTRKINSYTPMLSRRSTQGQLKINYLRESAQDFASNLETEENPSADFAESDFTFSEASVDLRKLANTMRFTAEELYSRNDFISLMTTRLVRGVMNRLEYNLVKGNNAGNQMRGLENYRPAAAGNTLSGTGNLGLDAIEDRVTDMMEVTDQTPVATIMPSASLSLLRQQKIAATDDRYLTGDPRERGPMVYWGVPVVVVRELTAGVVFVIDTRPVVLYDNGMPMEVRFTDSHAGNFVRDVWVAKTSIYAQQEFTRVVPAAGDLAHHYVQRISNFTDKVA